MPSHLPLSSVPIGRSVRITRVHSHPGTSTRLRELGLREDAVVRCIMRSHGNIICEVLDSRIGLDVELAGEILVDPQD